jgi:iron(III) transport system ATP-binding protein
LSQIEGDEVDLSIDVKAIQVLPVDVDEPRADVPTTTVAQVGAK